MHLLVRLCDSFFFFFPLLYTKRARPLSYFLCKRPEIRESLVNFGDTSLNTNTPSHPCPIFSLGVEVNFKCLYCLKKDNAILSSLSVKMAYGQNWFFITQC